MVDNLAYSLVERKDLLKVGKLEVKLAVELVDEKVLMLVEKMAV